jgi:hypothetical protein
MNIKLYPFLWTRGVYSNDQIPIFIRFRGIGKLEEYKLFPKYSLPITKYFTSYIVNSFNFNYFFITSKVVESVI